MIISKKNLNIKNIKYILNFLNFTVILYLNNFYPAIMFDQNLLGYNNFCQLMQMTNK